MAMPAPLGLLRGGTAITLSDGCAIREDLNAAAAAEVAAEARVASEADVGTDAELDGDSVGGVDLDEASQKKAAHARYMKFFRSVRASSCPSEVAEKYLGCKGVPLLVCNFA